MQYILMNKHTPILTCEIDTAAVSIAKIAEIQNPEYLPVGVGGKEGFLRKGLNEWWRSRSIPASRQGLENALREMGVSSKEELLLEGLGLSLSDQYWFNPNGELSWRDVNFFENPFSEEVGDILFGKQANQKKPDFNSPDVTSDGWLKKRWKTVEHDRCLMKGGSKPYFQEPVNEAFASSLLKRLGAYPYTHYKLTFGEDSKPYCICKNFITPDTELVTAWNIMKVQKKPNHVSEYAHLLNCCENLNIKGMKEFLDYQITFDHLIVNTDRHYNNFGVIRDVNTLEFTGIAPIYDNGTSLWYDEAESFITPRQAAWESKPFYPTPRQIELVSSFCDFNISKLSDLGHEFDVLLRKSPFISEARRNTLCQAIDERVDFVREFIDDQEKSAESK